MDKPGTSKYRFGPCEYDFAMRRLIYGQTQILVPLQESVLLKALLEQPGVVLPKTALAALLWPDQQYGQFDRAITNLISKVRRLHPQGSEWIETVPKGGYRFTLEVRHVFEEQPTERPAAVSQLPVKDTQPQPNPESLEGIPSPSNNRRLFFWASSTLALVALLAWAFAIGIRHTASAAPRPVVLGVLPFFSAEAEQESAETLREQAVDALASLPGCEIRSTRQLAAANEEPLDALAKRLHLDLFLSGRLNLTGNEYRLDLELTRSSDGVHLGSLHYHGTKAQLGEVPDRIASDLAPTLHKSTGQMQPQYLLGGTTNATAYELAFTAQTDLRRRTTPEVHEAVRLYTRAVTLDDRFARAWSGLAESYLVLATVSNVDKDLQSAKDAATHALSLEPHNPQAHATLGLALLQHDWQANQARTNLTAATTESPGIATNYLKLAVLLTDVGDFAAAYRAVARAQEIDPDWPVVYGTSMHVHIMSRQYKQAIQDATTLVQKSPYWGRAHEYLGWALWYGGQHENALKQWRQAAVLDNDPAGVRLQTEGALILQTQGVKAYSQYIVQRHGGIGESGEYVAAEWYAFAGDPNGTLDQLERLVATRNPEALKLLVNPAYDFVRSSPRFAKLENYMRHVLMSQD